MNNMLKENSNKKLFRKHNNNSKYRCNKIVLYMCTYRTESTSDGYNVAAFLHLSSSLSLSRTWNYMKVQKNSTKCHWPSIVFCLICLWMVVAFAGYFRRCRMCENEDVCRGGRMRGKLTPNYRNSDFAFCVNNIDDVWSNGNDSFMFFFLSFSVSAERHYNEMTRHHQFPVMQLPEGAQSLNNPKNASSVASPSLTSSLINNNCLLTLREMMQHQQQYQMHQYHHQQSEQKKRENAEQNEKSQIISTPISPNSSIKLSPKYHAEKHERESPFLIGKPDSMHRESRNEAGANCFKHVKSECQPTGRTVREELEASRSKIPKPGKVRIAQSSFRRSIIIAFLMLLARNKLNVHISTFKLNSQPLS